MKPAYPQDQLRLIKVGLQDEYYSRNRGGRKLSKVANSGVSPDSVKEYEPGDPPSSIDPYATARSTEGMLYARKRKIIHYGRYLLVVDVSSRQKWAATTANMRKTEACLETAHIITHALVQQDDRIALVLADADRSDTRMLTARRATREISGRLASATPSVADTLAQTLDSANLTRHNPQMIIIISDFLSDGWQEPLKRLVHRHEVIAVQVLDHNDLHLPNLGKSVRINGTVVDTRSAKVREAYDAMLAANQNRREVFFSQYGIRHLLMQNDQSLVEQLVRHLAPKRRSAS